MHRWRAGGERRKYKKGMNKKKEGVDVKKARRLERGGIGVMRSYSDGIYACAYCK